MKFKHITLVEQHVEKLVLALCVVFALFVAWQYILASGYSVEMGGRTIHANQIDQQLLDTAHTLEQRLTQGVPKELTQVQIPLYVDLFTKKLNRPLTPPAPQDDGSTPPPPPKAGNSIVYTGGSGIGAGPSEQSYRNMEIPAPDAVVVQPQIGTLAEHLPESLTQQVDPKSPNDVGWVSLALRLNVSKILKQSEPSSGTGAQHIPMTWMQELFAIADVQVQRRTLLDDGTWTQPVLVPLLLNQPSYRDLINSGQPPRDWRLLLEDIRTAQPDILTPQFFDLRNAVWTPPILPPSDAEVAAEEGTGPSDAASLQRQIGTLQERLEQYQSRPSTPQNERIIQQTQEQIDELLSQLNQLGANTQDPTTGEDLPPPDFVMPGADPTPPTPAASSGPTGRPESFTGAILSLDQLEMWAIDLDIHPGQTYQYRTRIVTTNPLFGRSLPKEQAALQNQFFIQGEWSEWSQPVQTLRTRYFFVIGGSGDQFASVELWRFNDGLWMKTTGRVSPGDPIGGTSTAYEQLSGTQPAAAGQQRPLMDFSTGYIAVDLDSDYKVAATGSTLRLLFDDDGRLDSRLELYDVQSRDDLKLLLFPELAQEREMTMRERQEAYKQRVEEARRAGATTTPQPVRGEEMQ